MGLPLKGSESVLLDQKSHFAHKYIYFGIFAPGAVPRSSPLCLSYLMLTSALYFSNGCIIIVLTVSVPTISPKDEQGEYLIKKRLFAEYDTEKTISFVREGLEYEAAILFYDDCLEESKFNRHICICMSFP